MLASINPLGERARNQRYWVTVVAYIVGSRRRKHARENALRFVGAPASQLRPVVTLAGVMRSQS